MRYISLLFLIVGLIAYMVFVKSSRPDLPEDFPKVSQKSDFDPDSLVGEWTGPGLLHLQGGENAMVIDGNFKVEVDSANRYRTITSISGHEYNYTDSGYISFAVDSVYWQIWDYQGNLMQFRGLLAQEVAWVVYASEDYEYRQTLHFLTSNSVYLKTELYKDQQLQHWLEISCRQ